MIGKIMRRRINAEPGRISRDFSNAIFLNPPGVAVTGDRLVRLGSKRRSERGQFCRQQEKSYEKTEHGHNVLNVK
ncbi:Hypothetical protein GbCGDNIH2_0409 [Granulibacter bethesdensis]|uniref:Uncharacterized protein n=1 Tax=Granulibacter bethesdensis (strain ATCC BAA-1260 / CGDNIH1) TaxID=391165 RepID=Q0BV45_GRABC|nr:Hypothetical protein GbCGDNIH1_0409 [Granulibacter bethesdensis CGDNIH1]APG30593.1 Hypothetical protein GbCGDNIH2_0409 [Granulibacter bethesdensis]APH51094.1 Hypothetical protein GbCGDNIH5_0409 [Granulibacter bethesdensis]APH63788.1 Hypothetical protein GbCGDNIH1I4_0409 [Granulibacter bethesdensis]